MNVSQLIKELQKFEPLAKVLVSSDEELNILFEKFEVATLDEPMQVVIYGLSGHEVDYDLIA
jgi:predicted glycosyltransferase